MSRTIFYSFRLYMGDFCPCCQGPQLSKLGFRGMLEFIILPCPNCSMRLYLPNLEFIQLLLGPLVPLGPLGLMGTHVPVTSVWGTQIEANYN